MSPAIGIRIARWWSVRCLNAGGGRNPTFVIRQRPLIFWVVLNPGIPETCLPYKFHGAQNKFFSRKSIEFVRLDKTKKKMTKNNDHWQTSWSPSTIPSSEGDEIMSTIFPAQRKISWSPGRRGKMSNWKPPVSAFPVTCSSTVYPELRSSATNFYIDQTTPLIWRNLLTCRTTPGPETIPSNQGWCPATI